MQDKVLYMRNKETYLEKCKTSVKCDILHHLVPFVQLYAACHI